MFKTRQVTDLNLNIHTQLFFEPDGVEEAVAGGALADYKLAESALDKVVLMIKRNLKRFYPKW